MLDTRIAILVRDGDDVVMARVERVETQILLPVIVRVELEGGLMRDPDNAAIRRRRLDAMVAAFATVAFDEPCAQAYGRIVAAAGYSRRKLLDRMIAAQALVHQVALATRNPQDFADVPGLGLEVW